MIKKLRRKITTVLMAIFSGILIVVLVNINYVNYKQSTDKSMYFLKKIIESDGKSEMHLEKDKLDDKRDEIKYGELGKDAVFRLSHFYTVKTDLENNVTEIENSESSGYTDEEISDFAKQVIENNNDKGSIENLLYNMADTDYGKIIVFIDNSVSDNNIRNLLYNSILIGSLGLIVLFIISVLLSKWIVRPVNETFEKQKQFISDASHELKTPLAVIGANADILESEIGKNKWLNYIENEVQQMDMLVNKLLTLASLEGASDKSLFKKFNLSKTVLKTAMPFESIAFEQGLLLNYLIDDNIEVFGDETELRQVTGILVDNAIKHTEIDGRIEIKLSHIRNKAVLEVRNTGKEISKEDMDRIFERFYRSDKSRNRNEKRYGLGLAIAKAIVEKHKGSIKVECKDGWTKFIVII